MKQERPKCIYCGSEDVRKNGRDYVLENDDLLEYQSYKCKQCKKRFNFGLYEGEGVAGRIEYFGIKLNANKIYAISKESFSKPTNELSSGHKKFLKEMLRLGEIRIPNSKYMDESHFTEEYVKSCCKDLRHNYDINMRYFDSLNDEEFHAYIQYFVEKNRLKKIENLNDVEYKSGVYLMVLGKYKQAYIGQSSNIKKRITQHWSSTKEFERRLYGNVEESKLPIDAFGAYDTTEIYCKPTTRFGVDEAEERLIKKFRKCYLINRVEGGINGELDAIYREVRLAAGTIRRKMK